ncbi:MAG: hypothetical protein J7604_07680 [Sporocytophaga sp.]|uniref:hypothetical protein n=1 Tax=Sporocytophaga sp. TaxID=2231183 RepID=UPI001B19045F|nr:hypothetical protein [Sporocytophaga sp.]MBO9700076.1 hypothetical protein [Sporocytophaga sp.]
MKNLFCTLTLLLGLTIIFSSCKKDSDPDCDLPKPNEITVKLKVNEAYQFDLGNFGDEEGASISKQATNYSVSTLERETSTGKVIYKYTPATNFTGTDEVQIKSERGSNGASPNNNITYMTIKFTIIN